jgi:hypothetical protein
MVLLQFHLPGLVGSPPNWGLALSTSSCLDANYHRASNQHTPPQCTLQVKQHMEFLNQLYHHACPELSTQAQLNHKQIL